VFEDAGLDSVMESRINGGAGDVIEAQDSREVYPCPTCGDALCNGGCDYGDESELHPDDEPRGSHDLSDDGDALASAGHGTDEDYGGWGGGED
jgi:hypothetical protein